MGAGCKVQGAECGAMRATYDLWAATYPPFAHNPVMRAEQSIVEPLLRRLGPRRALDVGTGSGRYLDLLAGLARSVVGIDFSLGMLRAGSQRTRPTYAGPVPSDPPVRAFATRILSDPPRRICADATRLPFRSGRFDVINASLMVGDIADLSAWAREMARALVTGGHLVYSDFHPTWTEFGWRRTFESADGVTHDLGFTPHAIDDHLEALDAAGFAVDMIREPRLVGDDLAVRRFRKKWGDPPVVVVFHATKRP